MSNYIISGIQQIGIGVEYLPQAWKYYIDVFNMDVRILEDDTVAELMLPYTGNSPQKRHAAIAINMQGGGGFEIWQYSHRKPKLIDFEINFGDIGIFAAKIKSRDVKKTFDLFSKNPAIEILGELKESIDGHLTFFVKDPYGNIFQIVYDGYIFVDEKRGTGGAVGAIIGVSDIEKALPVYQNILGHDAVVYDVSGKFDDLNALSAGDQNYRRVLLTHTNPRKGGFSKLFGNTYIELVQALDREPRKIYENRFWGDPGFIHLCFDVINMNGLKSACTKMGFPFTVDSSVKHNETNSFDMGEAAGHFSYIEDPDGNLIEFVETHKIPLIKKLGINLNLRKRNPEKPLPTWMLKFLKFGKVKQGELEAKILKP
jgi:catechol 2,3-dioxygenase-like lactoylglutathione lyase family enzyme